MTSIEVEVAAREMKRRLTQAVMRCDCGGELTGHVDCVKCGRRYSARELAERWVVKPENRAKSARVGAREIGVSQPTVSKARGDKNLSPEKVVGLDGKHYKAKPQRKVKTKSKRSKIKVPEDPIYTAVLGFVSELLKFNTDFTNRLRAWLVDRKLSREHSEVLQDRLHSCANDLHIVAQEIFDQQAKE